MLVIIDKTDNIQLAESQAIQFTNEIKSLNYLSKGLNFLYEQVNNWEEKVINRIPKNQIFIILGKPPTGELQDIPMELLACFFHWYSVSVCNYVRLVEWLANNSKEEKNTPNYIDKVIPQVHLWRNKVGAHFAKIKPKKDKDNAADLLFNTMYPISFDNDAFYASSTKMVIIKGGTKHESRDDMRWSLTKTHNELVKRYPPFHGLSSI
ncbi:MAG: hypothetical protein JXA01_07940 [Dehalococcoidia bacterium]|nr:hypothetical protein [Dehalococcoidia bacterium]